MKCGLCGYPWPHSEFCPVCYDELKEMEQRSEKRRDASADRATVQPLRRALSESGTEKFSAGVLLADMSG